MAMTMGNLYGGNAYGYASAGPSSRFSQGMRVVLISGEAGRDPSDMANPFWGDNNTYVAGIIEIVGMRGNGESEIIVKWDNGFHNVYSEQRTVLEYLENAPEVKKSYKTDLDTSKLDALVLDDKVKQEITALLYQHKHAAKLFDEWGLKDTIEYGKGMTMMFYGPPGTGKTWGANCIAKALNKELLTIGAAEIQTSEPGGANRNIQQAFEEATKKNKVLFIDECDSLISNRANLGMILASEINTLLTEIEKFEGVCILATNRIDDMDPALERRLALIVEFPLPNFEQRVAIWKRLIPSKMPLHSDVTVEKLAENEMAGGLIKNVVLQGARLAISENSSSVEMGHFERALERVSASKGLMGKQRIQHGGDEVGMTENNSKAVNRQMSAFFNNVKKPQ